MSQGTKRAVAMHLGMTVLAAALATAMATTDSLAAAGPSVASEERSGESEATSPSPEHTSRDRKRECSGRGTKGSGARCKFGSECCSNICRASYTCK